jgi:hypothetical protein
MSDVFKKLNLKDDDTEIVVLDAPSSFEPELAALKNVTIRRRAEDAKAITFFLAFVTKKKEIDRLAKILAKRSVGDVVAWFAYPKGSSKRYTSDFKMMTGWPSLGDAGFEVVRLVAIDEDWSAKRFRRAEFIKTMTRPKEWAMTPEGKKKARG